jgi:aminoglycoside phosphotransferase (APT) family kinase protein
LHNLSGRLLLVDLAGLDLAALSAWLEPPLTAALVAGGKSNLTYRIDDGAGRSFALRRPPLGKLLPKAHDVLREHRLISALYGRSAVPVPRPVAACSDTDVIGAPFFLMDFVEGRVLRNPRAGAEVSEAVRAAAADHLIDTLVALHTVEPAEVGLEDLAPSGGYIVRQVNRWQQQFDRSRTRDVPDVDAVGRWLADNVPPQKETRLVHGDFRLDNAIIDGEGRILAVLDWEIATLGDPLADLAILLVYWGGDGEEAIGATGLPGFPDRAAVTERYAVASGRDLSELDYHRVFAYWKLACVAEGVYARYSAGGGGGDSRVDLAGLSAVTLGMAARARALIS